MMGDPGLTPEQREAQRATDTLNNYYADALYRIGDAIGYLTETDTTERQRLGYSDEVIARYVFSPLVWLVDTAGAGIQLNPESHDKWVHISVDSSERITPPGVELAGLTERLAFRLELFLEQTDNNPAELTRRTTKLQSDFRLAFAKSRFLADPGLGPIDNPGTSPTGYLARIRDADLVRWMYDERLRGTNQEILIFIFQLEVVTYNSGI